MMHITRKRMAASRVFAIGMMLAALMAAFSLEAKPSYASTTFTFTNTKDSGAGSLRQAILDANASTTADVIEFYITGSGVHTIVPLSQLPTVTGPVSINGYSQPGAQPNQKAVGSDAVFGIVLSGAEAMGADGLVISAANTTVKGLVINSWTSAGVRIDSSGATGNKIAGNFVGTDASGTNALSNSVGVRVYEGSNNTIGGTTAAARNVISGNVGHGVNITATATGPGGNTSEFSTPKKVVAS